MSATIPAGLACIALLAGSCGRLGFERAADSGEPPDADEPAADAGDDAAAPGYRATAVRFDPVGGDYIWTGALANTTSSGRGTFSAWLRFTGGDDAQQLIAVAQVVAIGGVLRTAGNQIRFAMYSCGGVPLLDMQTDGTYTSTSGWVHVLAAWDLAAGRADLYVNDVADRSASPTIVNGPICYDSVKWGIGGITDGAMTADLAELYAALGTYVDLSVVANRRLFRDAAGKPAELGPACSTPTGSPPTGCFVGEPATWHVNEGTGGGFTLEGDGLAAAPTSPSD